MIPLVIRAEVKLGEAQAHWTCAGYGDTINAAVAQLVEHLIAIQKVAGSNPVSRSKSHIEG